MVFVLLNYVSESKTQLVLAPARLIAFIREGTKPISKLRRCSTSTHCRRDEGHYGNVQSQTHI
jgi:hypothetical protein